MPNIYLQVVDELVENPSPEEGEITLSLRAWYGPGQFINMTAYVNFNDQPNQMNNKVRSTVVQKCGLEGVTVTTSDKVIMGGTFAPL